MFDVNNFHGLNLESVLIQDQYHFCSANYQFEIYRVKASFRDVVGTGAIGALVSPFYENMPIHSALR